MRRSLYCKKNGAHKSGTVSRTKNDEKILKLQESATCYINNACDPEASSQLNNNACICEYNDL